MKNRLFVLSVIISIGLTGCGQTGADGENVEEKQSSIVTEDSIIENQVSEKEKSEVKSVYYFYNQLSNKDKATYEMLLSGMTEGVETIRIDETDEEVIQTLMHVILFDHPEIFWCNGAYQYISYETYTEVLPTYQYLGDEKKARINDIEIATADFFSTLDSEISDYDKIKSVYEYVIQTVNYELGVADDQNIYSSLVNKTSVCAGYSRATQYLLQKVGIECLFVEGEIVNRGRHAWNIVKCEDKYYQLDVTFGDHDFTNSAQSFEYFPQELDIDYSYLCCTDAQMNVDHMPQMPMTLPVCTDDRLNYYKNNSYYFETYSNSVSETMRKTVYDGKNVWQCQFKNQQDYLKMKSEIEAGLYTDFVVDYLKETKGIYSCRTWYMYSDEMLVISCWYQP